MESCLDNIAICGNIARIESLCFKSIVVNRPFENTIIVIIIIIDIEDSIVIVIKRVCTKATIESFQQIVDSIVVIIKIVQIADSIVVVVITI